MKEGTIELTMKLEGVHFALGMELAEFPTEELFDRGLKILIECVQATLVDRGYWTSNGICTDKG